MSFTYFYRFYRSSGMFRSEHTAEITRNHTHGAPRQALIGLCATIKRQQQADGCRGSSISNNGALPVLKRDV